MKFPQMILLITDFFFLLSSCSGQVVVDNLSVYNCFFPGNLKGNFDMTWRTVLLFFPHLGVLHSFPQVSLFIATRLPQAPNLAEWHSFPLYFRLLGKCSVYSLLCQSVLPHILVSLLHQRIAVTACVRLLPEIYISAML